MSTPKDKMPSSFVDADNWYLPDTFNNDDIYYHRETYIDNGVLMVKMENKKGDVKVISFIEATALHMLSLGLVEL